MSNNRRRNNKNKQSKTRKNKKNSRRRGGFVSRIKQIPEITRSLRYVFDDTTSRITVSSTDLLRIMGAVVSGATTYYPLIQSVRLVSVTVTVLSNASTGASVGSFQWLGTNAPTMRETIASAQGVPAKETFYPPLESSAGWWYDQTSTAEPIFAIDMLGVTSEPVAYVDLHFVYTQADGAVTNAALSVASGFTGIGYRFLGNGSYPVGLSPVDLNVVH